jgi:alpha-tubulin suppressor-like RCC1 family protein
MPNFSGVWNLKEQIQAVAAGTWTGLPTSELYAWGAGSSGQLGDGTAISKSSPIQVSGENWAQISAGSGHAGVVKADGTLFMWGYNIYGQLGDGTTVSKSSPIQVGALTNWAQVAMGNSHTACVTTSGAIFTWGAATTGPLGHNDTINRSSPVQVGALTNWAQVAAGNSFTACVTTSGTLFTWGYNNLGQLGDGTVISRSSPVQVGALTNWSQASTTVNATQMACITSAGTLFAWGQNTSGQIGDGTVIRRSSPVQVGASTGWTKVSAGSAFTIAILQGSTN